MRIEKETINRNGLLASNGQDKIDPEALWLDQDIDPDDFVRLDPLDITIDMVEQVEHPELADFVLRRLPD